MTYVHQIKQIKDFSHLSPQKVFPKCSFLSKYIPVNKFYDPVFFALEMASKQQSNYITCIICHTCISELKPLLKHVNALLELKNLYFTRYFIQPIQEIGAHCFYFIFFYTREGARYTQNLVSNTLGSEVFMLLKHHNKVVRLYH